MIKNKEDILYDKSHHYFNHGDDGPYWDEGNAYGAMQEYSKQEILSFITWAEDSDVKLYHKDQDVWFDMLSNEKLTFDQVYARYIDESKSKQ